ncbi:MAG TPA: signal recognition particle-docking protein FtsY, partial [Firmicutes bacterium]|nr:signal recognition particle-docking protein FtsY [Bacillota bacterium]
SRGTDVVICDTAGRLHTRSNLMEELKKIARVAAKACAGAPHEVLLVIDATTGQNAVAQAELFHDAVNVTGLVLTKLDGTAKGGIAVAVCDKLGIPIKYVGMGEGLEDLHPFNAENFVRALLDL